MPNVFSNSLTDGQYNKIISRLDNTQKDAALSQEPNIVIRAPAGAGKTSDLIAAICVYKYENVNARVCAITYTRAARAEMENRLHEYGVYDVEVGTIHA